MMPTQCLMKYFKRSLQQRHCVHLSPHIKIQQRQIVQARRGIGMICTKRFLANRKSTLIQRKRGGIVTLSFIQ